MLHAKTQQTRNVCLPVALLCCACLSFTVPLNGCDNTHDAPPTEPPIRSAEVPQPDWSSPESAARSALLCLVAELRAIAANDAETLERCRLVLRSVAAESELKKRLERRPQLRAFLGDDLVEGYLSNWGSAIAYYADGLELAGIRRGVPSGGPSRAAVLVPARGPAGSVTIRAECIRGKDGRWRVIRMGFAAPAPTSRAANVNAP